MAYSRSLVKETYEIFTKRLIKKTLTPFQLDGLTSLMNKKDTLCVLPTGHGKSLIFEAAPILKHDLTGRNRHFLAIVVMPLVSLISAAQQKLENVSICVAAIHSDVKDIDKVYDALQQSYHLYDLVLITPEAAIDKKWFNLFTTPRLKRRICCVVWDEAHCVSTWGNDFRDSYLESTRLRTAIGCPALLLTATCDNKIQKDLEKAFDLKFDVIATIPDRPNIYLSIGSKSDNKLDEVLIPLCNELLEKGINMPKTIIYIQQRQDIDAMLAVITSYLYETNRQDQIRHVQAFCAESGKETKQSILEDWMGCKSTVRLLIATVAFGMGIDVSDVRRVVHWGVPKSLAAYTQEIGRAGRDGERAEACLYVVPRLLSARHKSKQLQDEIFLQEVKTYAGMGETPSRTNNVGVQATAEVADFCVQSTEGSGTSMSRAINLEVENKTKELCWRNYVVSNMSLDSVKAQVKETSSYPTALFWCCSICRQRSGLHDKNRVITWSRVCVEIKQNHSKRSVPALGETSD